MGVKNEMKRKEDIGLRKVVYREGDQVRAITGNCVFDSDLRTLCFERTPIMSTYLLAFYVGESDFVEKIIQKPGSDEDLTVRVYTPKGKSNQGKFALDLTCKVHLLF